MCGRYTIRKLDLLVRDNAQEPPLFEEFDERVSFTPRYNVAPGQLIPVVRMNADDVRTLGLAKWGLIPHFNKTKPKIAPINARSETILEKPMYRQAISRRRACVPADGFFEPKKDPNKKAHDKNDQYFFHFKDDRPFAIAAIWERWSPSPGETEDTVALLTTQPNRLVASIHDRMPVILEPKDYARWLDRTVPAADVANLLQPYHAPEAMESWQVNLLINDARHDGPDCIAPR